MFQYLLLILIINGIGFLKYINYSMGSVSYKKQIITDFLCPIGSIIARILLKFKLKENPKGYILGLIFELCITMIALCFL